MATVAEHSATPEARSASPENQTTSSLGSSSLFDWFFDEDIIPDDSYLDFHPNMPAGLTMTESPRPLPSQMLAESTRERSTDNFIDLTEDQSPPHAARPTSQRPASRDREPELKRRRVADEYNTQASGSSSQSSSIPLGAQMRESFAPRRDSGVEEVDLTQVEDEADLKRHQEERARRKQDVEEQQQQLLNDSIASQNPPGTGSSTLSQLSCIICMENITDLTATHCGHIFCHTCIMEALIAGENQGHEPGKGRSRCPVCREKVARRPAGKKHPEVIPLELKLKKINTNAKGKQRDVQAYADPPIGD